MLNVLAGFIRRQELAKQLRKTSRHLHRWEAEGYGPPVTRIGKLVLYKVSSVTEWLNSLENGQQRRRKAVK
jgi:predicted DNA-binding transcriptional regulator AlpA